ncbi:urea ABC transporter permease subunit UrtC [Siccirubricoccus sp. KC 17139]|uniref:Urea ABC transporter permease subunit UrtC n=1 Tax=Siccirubricoccus soli TaxID=2899147 RepID=A0ABT1CZD7_9PROT|nr:urea ABC transporter permease subunit UrtC [Siccirubricoccus soli]MCO6415012.1 urea ABC transporter permease subunit UrtC [Siccirubricoccus soli]MCP2681143.1 urea ABC transporter permease subunit UrtC [Siccirubricoccus soli]
MTLRLVLIGAVLILALLPVLNQMPTDSALHVSDFVVTVCGKWITYAVLALAIDLAWGYAGILSLGHGAFFALGGYAMGMHLMRLIGPRGVYGHPVLPDFMVFLGYQELPWYWLGFDHFPFAILMAMAVPGLLALVVGYLAFRSRITGVYLSIITQAMTYALMLAFFRNDMGFGGNNGFTDFKELLGMPLNTPNARSVLFYASLALLLGALWLCSAVTRSKLGRVLVAIRDAESRVRFLGYDVTQHKLFVFVLSAVLAGLAGALYVPQVGIINPGEFSPANSIEAVIWVAVGGRGTLLGALLGAFSVNALKTWLTTVAPDLWLFALGGLFVAVTLFLPRGLIGLFTKAPK